MARKRIEKPREAVGMEAVFGGVTGGVIASTFAKVEVCERVLKEERAKARTADERARIESVFAAAVPGELLRGKGADIYAAHVRELLARALEGADPRPATVAEVVCFLSEASLAAPLRRDHAELYEVLFTRVLPAHAARLARERTGRGWMTEELTHEGEVLLRELRNRLFVADRKFGRKS